MFGKSGGLTGKSSMTSSGAMKMSSSKSSSAFISGKSSNNMMGSKSSTPMLGSKSASIPVGKSSSLVLGSKSPTTIPSSKTSPSFLGGKTSNTFNFSGSSPASSKSDPFSFNPKNQKTKTSFGIIWIPTKKRTNKNMVYRTYDTTKDSRYPSMYNYMSGDSDYQTHKKKEEEANLIIPERSKVPLATVASGSAVAASEAPPDNLAEEKQEFIRNDSEERKEATGDSNIKVEGDNDKDYLENKDTKNPENKSEKDKIGDKVDSVYLRPPPPHKTQSNTTTEEEDGCGIKCLYYTLQCCDCVLQ